MAHAVSVKPYNQIYHHLLAVRYTNLIQCLRLMTCPEKKMHTVVLCVPARLQDKVRLATACIQIE